MAILSVIVSRATQLPTVLTGLALRIEKFTVTKMSTSRWQIDIGPASQEALADLIDVLPVQDVEIHKITP